ncbi:MAG: ABC transporter ATP-binding protein [Candidatus Zhuqueibacterota bacterium]
MSMTAVHFEHVTKEYRLGSAAGNLRDLFPRALHRLSHGKRGSLPDRRTFHALDDVNLSIQNGEAFGIIGPNGAGKTTALKLLSGITTPTSGTVRVAGRVAALIELGAGLHPDLSGRENIFLYGAIMGLRRREIEARFDDMVAFAELEHFIDAPLKRYSSGMQVRLAFSVVAHIDCDVLLVDEVLAVGDMSFREKCQIKMSQFMKAGKTIVFVSHNIYAVQSLCQRTLYLKKGRVHALGETRDVVRTYINDTHRDMLAHDAGKSSLRWGTGDVQITSVKLLNRAGVQSSEFRSGDAMRLVFGYHAGKRISQPNFQAIVTAPGGVQVFVASSAQSGFVPAWIQGEGQVVCDIGNIPLLPRSYSITANICSQDRRIDYDTLPDALRFAVLDEERAEPQSGNMPIGDSALVRVPFSFSEK